MKTFALVVNLLLGYVVFSQINIIPQPAEMKVEKGSYLFKQPVGFIYYNGDVPGNHGTDFFKDYLKKYYNVTEFQEGSEHSYGLPAEIFLSYEENYSPKDGYELAIDKKGIHIAGNDVGIFNAFQTLIQLFPPHVSNNLIQLPYLYIKDYPHFGYRGLHLDVGRHFFPVSFIKKYLEYMALHKLNYFHWHLTEDQGWRIEIKKYPNLTTIGAWRNGTIIGRYPGKGNDGIRTGGFYTQEEIKEIVRYAADRYITVVPEIEMPGHGSAAIASYPFLSCFPDEPTIKYFPKNCVWSGDETGKQVQQTWGVFNDVFCAGKEETFKFLKDVIDEIIPLFPGKYIHVGGDECPKSNWKKCPSCQKRIKENNLKDEHELQSYLIQRMEKYINGKGKTLIGWDEILEGGLAPNAVVMSWRGEKGGIEAAKQDHFVIMTPGNPVYFDHTQNENEDSVTIGGYNPIEKVYAYDPIPAALNSGQAKYILGGQANVWTEYMKNERKVEYMILPRLSALSEILWSSKELRNWENFEKRLLDQFKRYDLWHANYSSAYYDIKASVIPSQDRQGVLWKLTSKMKNGYIGYPPSMLSSAIVKYTTPIKILRSETYSAHYFLNGKNVLSVTQKFNLNKATGKKISLNDQPSDSYKGDGAFTLVNGVQNEKGLARSKEFLGFSGTDCNAVIDLSKEESISTVIVHSMKQEASWIWQPLQTDVFISRDGKNFSAIGSTATFTETSGANGIMKVEFDPHKTRFLKIIVKNQGDIPEGSPGSGNKAWLFIDEIEIN